MRSSVMTGRRLRVALLGLGTVGGATAERLIDERWHAEVARRGMVPPVLVAVGVHEPDRPRGIDLPASVRRTDQLDELVVDPDVDVVVELIGGVERPAGLVERAISAGKDVVTANKAMLARRGPALEAATRGAGVALRFEAAVAGGIPLLTPLVRDLAANRIAAVRGIVNGTTNLILSSMARDGQSYEAALDSARARGYAEADATADVEGRDAADKLAILSRLTFGGWPDVDGIRRGAPDTEGDGRPGITGVRTAELRSASKLGLTIKLVAEARAGPAGGVMAGVMPVAVRASSPIGATDRVSNLVEIHAEPIGVVSIQGQGAGGAPTSSAILADLLALSRGEGSTWGPLPEPSSPLTVIDPLPTPRAWFLIATDAVGDGVAERLSEITLVSAGDAIVTHPMGLDELRCRLRDRGVRATLYPLLAEE